MRSERTPVGGTFITTFLKTLSLRDRENKEAGSRDPRAEGLRDRENIMHHELKAHITHEPKASKFHGDRQKQQRQRLTSPTSSTKSRSSRHPQAVQRAGGSRDVIHEPKAFVTEKTMGEARNAGQSNTSVFAFTTQ